MASLLAGREHTYYTPCRRDGHTRWADALPAHTTYRVLAAPSTGHLALLVTGRVPLECALAQLGRWTGRLRRPWGCKPPNCEASIPKAKAIEGEPIRISRLQAGESQTLVCTVRCSAIATVAPRQRDVRV